MTMSKASPTACPRQHGGLYKSQTTALSQCQMGEMKFLRPAPCFDLCLYYRLQSGNQCCQLAHNDSPSHDGKSGPMKPFH